MNQCYYYLDLISGYIDDELSPSEKIGFEEHIKNCSDCAAQYSEILDMVNCLKIENEIELPENFHRDFMTKLYKRKNKFLNLHELKIDLQTKGVPRKHIFAFAGIFAAVTLFFVSLSSVTGIKNNSHVDIVSENQSYAAGLPENNILGTSENISLDDAVSSKRAFSDDYVLNYDINIIVDDVNDAVNEINRLRGINIYSDISQGRAFIEREVDKDYVETLLATLSKMGVVNSFSENRQSIAYNKIDNEAKMKTKTQERERLYALLEKAPDAEYLYKVYDRIIELENEVATISAMSRNYDISSGSSVININIESKPRVIIIEDKDIFLRCKDAFIGSINFSVNIVDAAVISLTAVSIPLLIIIFIGYAVIKIIKRGRKS